MEKDYNDSDKSDKGSSMEDGTLCGRITIDLNTYEETFEGISD